MNISVGYSSGLNALKKTTVQKQDASFKALTFGKDFSSSKYSSSSSDSTVTKKRKSDADKLREAAYQVRDPAIRKQFLELAEQSETAEALQKEQATLTKTAAQIADPTLKQKLIEAAEALSRQAASQAQMKMETVDPA